MKKKIVVFLSLVLVMCCTLCACGVCRTCEGDGRISCTNSDCHDGTIYHCNECDLTAYTYKFEPCDAEDCYSGRIWKICPECKALGTLINPITWQKVTCPVCDGAGDIEYQCDSCDGEGGEHYYECGKCARKIKGETCPKCNGASTIDCPGCEEE